MGVFLGMIYTRRSRMGSRQQGRLIELFVVGATARAAGEVAGVQANTAARFFMRLRQLIASKLPSYELDGEVEADESYFGGARKGKRGRGAAGKVAVFGLLKRRGTVFTAIIPPGTALPEPSPARKCGHQWRKYHRAIVESPEPQSLELPAGLQ